MLRARVCEGEAANHSDGCWLTGSEIVRLPPFNVALVTIGEIIGEMSGTSSPDFACRPYLVLRLVLLAG